MELFVEIRGNTLLAHISGELDDHAAKQARDSLEYVLLRKEIKHLVFDLSELKFMDSAGIGLFMGRYKTLKERAGRVMIVAGNEKIIKILKMSGISKLMPIAENTDSALSELHCKALI